MKAWVLHGIYDIRLEEVEQPPVGKEDVLISVKACGICGSDIPRIYSTGAHEMPLIPGHEFAGEVVQAGDGVDPAWIGKRVGVFPLIPCQTCPACNCAEYELCDHYDYLGSRRDGAFAEYVAVPAWNLLELPDSVPYEAAAMLEPMAVAVHAMRRVPIQDSGAVLVYGVGTIGMLLTMFLLERGNHAVYVIGNKQFQKEMLTKNGLPENHFFNGAATDATLWIQARTQGQGADAVFECVGGNETIAHSLQCVRPGGHVCMIGNPRADISLAKDVYWKILRKQITVTGTWNSSFQRTANDDWSYVIQSLQRGSIHPQKLITHILSIDRLEEGLHIMRDKTQDYVKIMMVPQ